MRIHTYLYLRELLIRTHTYVYLRVNEITFSENFGYVLNKYPKYFIRFIYLPRPLPLPYPLPKPLPAPRLKPRLLKKPLVTPRFAPRPMPRIEGGVLRAETRQVQQKNRVKNNNRKLG